MNDRASRASRREILTGLRGAGTANQPPESPARQQAAPPSAGSTIRLSTTAMACDFSVIMNPGPTSQIEAAGQVLELIHSIEDWMSLYRESSELSRVNQSAGIDRYPVRPEFFRLLQLAVRIQEQTSGAFDMATGSLTRLWRLCRKCERIPDVSEVDDALQRSGMHHVRLDEAETAVELLTPGVILDPGAIGKGFALDEASTRLSTLPDAPESWLMHGGHSSLIARGPHHGHAGWPVGIGNPLFTEQRLGTVLLCDSAMATSGSNIQFFRVRGKRYGHLLDPRTGWPVEGMLSVTVLAPSAAAADALSTAFFVMGVDEAKRCCANLPGVGAILLPFPDRGTKVRPTVVGIPADLIVWDESQVDLSECR